MSTDSWVCSIDGVDAWESVSTYRVYLRAPNVDDAIEEMGRTPIDPSQYQAQKEAIEFLKEFGFGPGDFERLGGEDGASSAEES